MKSNSFTFLNINAIGAVFQTCGVYLDSFFQMKNTSIRIRPPEVIESTVCL